MATPRGLRAIARPIIGMRRRIHTTFEKAGILRPPYLEEGRMHASGAREEVRPNSIAHGR